MLKIKGDISADNMADILKGYAELQAHVKMNVCEMFRLSILHLIF